LLRAVLMRPGQAADAMAAGGDKAMRPDGAGPVHLTGLAALRWGFEFAREPLIATVRAHQSFGPFVTFDQVLPLLRTRRTVMLGVPLVLTAGAAFHSELLSNPDTWRGVSLLPGGPRGSAARRIGSGLTRLTGERHAHYRKLVLQPLRRGNVDALTARMAQIADAEVASWPLGTPIDLWEHVRRIMRSIALDLLFGGESEQNRAIADLVSVLMERKWGAGAFALPLNLPFTTYGKIVREAAELERRMLDWVAQKRGRPDPRDLAAIIVNSADADGSPPDEAAILGQLASLFAAASEAAQSALTWTLFLLIAHPRVAAALRDEIRQKLGAAEPTLEKAAELPYLDAVVKEGMRILPPVPIQMRVAQADTAIAGHAVPNNTRVMLNTFLTNRAPGLFPEGDVFRPERWSAIAPSMFEYPVFSAGPHACPGYSFGSVAVKIALAAIFVRYRMELPYGARVDYGVQPTFRPRGRLPVILRRADYGGPAAAAIVGTIRDLVRFPH
jgi:cytochrome P450